MCGTRILPVKDEFRDRLQTHSYCEIAAGFAPTTSGEGVGRLWGECLQAHRCNFVDTAWNSAAGKLSTWTGGYYLDSEEAKEPGEFLSDSNHIFFF